MDEIVTSYENQQYKKSLLSCLISLRNWFNEVNCLYIIKNTITLDGFSIKDQQNIKKLFFYYWFLKKQIKFENGYSFSFKNIKVNINSLIYSRDKYTWDFRQYFEFGDNKIFLSKIYDKSYDSPYNREWGKEVDNIIDFFLYFCRECSELYSFSGKNFPLFKWIISELCDEVSYSSFSQE